MDHLNLSSSGESIKVFVRVRPPDPNLESELEQGTCLSCTTDSSLTVYSKPEPKVFTFDNVAGINTTQEDVFLAIGRPIIDSCMCGYNGTIFAYGQTGSGKTFTMIGPPSEESDSFSHELRGVIPRSFEYLFSLINREKQKYGDLVEFLCKCSFLEIYNEQVYDLLDSASCGLHLRENMKHGVYVDGLTERSISSARDAYNVLTTGWVNRTVASTSMNRESSRSHAVFTLTIESKKRESKDSVAKIKTSLLNLVDLAGSERQRDTHTAGVRLKEAGSINKSLSALGNVIMALVDIANGKSRHVHYRDSKLTFLLRDSLGGNAKTNLVANVHPSARCFGETLSTLNFARRAKMIKNKAVVNEDASGNVLQLQAEIKRLRHLLEKYKAGVQTPSRPASPCMSFSAASGSSGSVVGYGGDSMRSDDEKAICELKEMLAVSMETRDKSESDKMTLLDRVDGLQKLCDKKEKFLQSMKMILKFRETHISNLEKGKQSNPASAPTQDTIVTLLRQEIEQLKYMVQHHPDVTKTLHENIDLKAEIKRMQKLTTGERNNLSRELARAHKYTLQLERQLRNYLARGSSSGSDTLSSLKMSASMTPTKSTLDLEHLQSRGRQLQEELDKCRQMLSVEREQFSLKESKLESSLNTMKKANQELERSIQALKLKNSVERATLNDMHMNTIKSILSPRRDRETVYFSKSVGNTPIRRADSDPIKQQLSFTGLLNPPTSPYKNSTISESPELPRKRSISALVNSIAAPPAKSVSTGSNTSPCDDSNDDSDVEEREGDELNIEGALTDELKILQDTNRQLQQQIEELELKVVHLSHEKATLQAQLDDLGQLSKSEHEATHEREQGFLEKITELTARIADLTSANTVLDGEVLDLRVCLKSADRELSDLKKEHKEEKKTHENRVMEHMQRIGELEQLLSSRVSDIERKTEEFQSLQVEAETLREELTFKDHHVGELEQALLKEKEQVSSLEGDVQSLLDKLTYEVEKNTRLSSELQKGHHEKEEWVGVMEENSQLKAEVEQLESDLQSQLRSFKKQLEESEVTINSLLRRQATDESAISGLMGTVQELRSVNATSEAKITSLSKEVDDSKGELNAAALRIDQLISEVDTLKNQLSNRSMQHRREIMKKDSEREVVSDELDRLNEQYQQLSVMFESQTREISEAQSETAQLREEITSKDAELNKLHQQQKDRRSASFSRKLSSDALLEEKCGEIEQLKERLDHAASMIDSYEHTREEKNKELQLLKEKLALTDKLQSDYETLCTEHNKLQYRLTCTEQQLAQGEAAFQAELKEIKAELQLSQRDCVAAIKARDKAQSEQAALHAKYTGQKSTVDALTDQLERYKVHEERLFAEKEALRSQLEAVQEEKVKLLKECENLAKENATITGHRNIRQKIQYHASIKMENNKLKEEVIQLGSRLKHKSEQVQKLQQLLMMGNSKESSSKPHNKRIASQPALPTEVELKENIAP